MKRKLIAVVLAATLALVLVMPAQAAVTMNHKVPIEATIWSPCAGEWIHLQGEVHMLWTLTWDGAGGYHAVIHFNRPNVKGTGLSSGAKYIFNGGENNTYNVSSELPPWDQTVVTRLRMVGTGGANSGTLHTVYHITVNANGEVTVVFNKAHASCK